VPFNITGDSKVGHWAGLDETAYSPLKEEEDETMELTPLQKAAKKRAENRAAGIKPPNPIERSNLNPNSMRFAINAMCFDCMGQEPGWRNMVKACTSPNCPIYKLRPGK
jgi:hypothetical protein